MRAALPARCSMYEYMSFLWFYIYSTDPKSSEYISVQCTLMHIFSHWCLLPRAFSNNFTCNMFKKTKEFRFFFLTLLAPSFCSTFSTEVTKSWTLEQAQIKHHIPKARLSDTSTLHFWTALWAHIHMMKQQDNFPEVGAQMFLFQSTNLKSSNSWAHFAIANPQISLMCKSANRQSAIFYDESANHESPIIKCANSLIADPQFFLPEKNTSFQNYLQFCCRFVSPNFFILDKFKLEDFKPIFGRSKKMYLRKFKICKRLCPKIANPHIA